jgi:hypothetical protein
MLFSASKHIDYPVHRPSKMAGDGRRFSREAEQTDSALRFVPRISSDARSSIRQPLPLRSCALIGSDESAPSDGGTASEQAASCQDQGSWMITDGLHSNV